MNASIIFRAGALPAALALPIMKSIERMTPASTRLVLSFKPYPRQVGWINEIDARWWSGRDYLDAVDKFTPLIPPTDTFEDRMRVIVATTNTMHRFINFNRGFTYEFIIERQEIISVPLSLTEVIYIKDAIS